MCNVRLHKNCRLMEIRTANQHLSPVWKSLRKDGDVWPWKQSIPDFLSLPATPSKFG